MSNLLGQPLKLANGVVLKNRLAKAATSETLGTWSNRPTRDLATLCGRWVGAFLQGLHDAERSISADFVKVMWFQRLTDFLRLSPAK